MKEKSLKILVLGSGGREHALCWKIAQSPLLDKLYCAPGNGGIESVADCVTIDIESPDAVLHFTKEKAIDLVVIGPEGPLVSGLVDTLIAENIAAFGPVAAAAQLEGSKGFTKDICAAYDIPTAAYGRFKSAADAHAYLDTHPAPIVVKADGLAAGKGVIIAETDAQARAAVDDIFDGAFGEAGAELVIEEFMTGEEASFFVLTDGTHALPLATAQDHKRVGEGDTGLNTGGMGAYSPAKIVTPTLLEETMTRIIQPTLTAMADKETPYRGVLYAGLMLTEDGPKLVEYNARFGDPECQVLMLRLKSDLVPALLATAHGDISSLELEWYDEDAMTVVMAAQGYPGIYPKGSQINNLHAAVADTDTQIFHAGTKTENGKTLAVGGRVLNVTSKGQDLRAARDKAYAALEKVDWQEGFYRRDIGWRALGKS